MFEALILPIWLTAVNTVFKNLGDAGIGIVIVTCITVASEVFE